LRKHSKLYLQEATKLLREIKMHKSKKLSKNCGISNIIAGFYLLIGRIQRTK